MGIREKSTRFKELYCASIAYIPVLISGMQAGFPAFIVPQLRREINMDMDQLSWLASLGYFSLILGPFVTMLFINKYGRKTNLRLILLLFAIGWTIICISNNFANLIIGLMLCGIASGSSSIVASVYVSEISRSKFRGFMLSMLFLFNIIGTSIVYSLEYYLPWRRAVAVIIILSFFGILLQYTIPESKLWYLMCDQKEKAKGSALWFEDTPVVAKEVDISYLFIKLGKLYEHENGANQATSNFSWSSIKKLRVKPFLLATIVSILRCGTGKVLFIVYPVNLFTDMHTPFDSFALGIWYSFINVLCSFVNMIIFTIVDKFNRKRFFYTLSAIMIATMSTIVSIEFLFDEFFKPMPGLRIFCMYVYLIVEATGYFCITSIMIFEVVPINQRGLVGSLNLLLANIISAVYVKLFPSAEQHFTFGTLCGYFLLNIVLIVWIVHRFYPESRGRLFLGTDGAMGDAFINGKFDAILKEDWLRNEKVQAFFTANGNFNVDQLDIELLKNMRHEWLDKMKEMLIMNGADPSLLMGFPIHSHKIMNVVEPANSSLPVPDFADISIDNPFDFEKVAENSQLWLTNMKASWNSWSQNELVTGNSKAFKQQQKWFKEVWMKNVSMPTMSKKVGSNEWHIERKEKTGSNSMLNKNKTGNSSQGTD